MSSSRSSRSSHSGSTRSSGSRSSTSSRPSQQTLTLLSHLTTNPPTTLSSLLHLEQTITSSITSSITSPSSSSSSIQIPPSEISLFQAPMTAAFENYVITSQSLLVELRGLTPNYPFSAQIIPLAVQLVRGDRESDRSWNLAWLVLNKILNASEEGQGLVERVAWEEAGWEGYWGGRKPTESEQGTDGTEGGMGGGERGALAGEMARSWRGAVERLVGCWGGRRPEWY